MASPMDSKEKGIARAAFAAAVVGVLGLIGVQLWLRPGLPFDGVELSQRASYLERHHKCWTWGWLLAGAGALLVVNLYRVLATRWRSSCEGYCRMVCCSRPQASSDLAGIASDDRGAGAGRRRLGLAERWRRFFLFVAKYRQHRRRAQPLAAGRNFHEDSSPCFGVWLVSGLRGPLLVDAARRNSEPGHIVILFHCWSTLLDCISNPPGQRLLRPPVLHPRPGD